MSRFFIDRPIFASVLSIVLVIAGIVSLFYLPVAQYPEITPPTVQVYCSYPGANAQVVADTVAAPIEQQVNGVENMLYMSSQCTNDGTYSLTITFTLGTDLDMAQVLVQNRVAQAMPLLPDIVKQTGVTTKKRSPNIMLVVNLYSPDNRFDQLYLSNYATTQVRDELARLEGVGDVAYLGQQDYSMRVWLDVERLASRGLTADDIAAALKEQNVQVAAGQLGQPPTPSGQQFQYVLSTLGRLREPDQFRRIVVKTGDKGQLTYLEDVANVELGAYNEDQTCSLDGRPSVGLAVFQMPGTNALDTTQRVQDKMVELQGRFPEGLDYAIVYDTTPFIEESIHEVLKALRDAVILVGLVVLIFLQNWRSTIIPLVAVPVSLVGTFVVMALMGFSLNNLTLLGLVLAIGIVVDDAIVVVENVERWIEKGLPPRQAAYKAMDEVTVAVIAIAFGLSAVFIPTAFITGITGQFYRQFALTIATATLISAFNSLTLSPALAAILLKPRHEQRDWLTRVLNFGFGWFFAGFNRVFDATTSVYSRMVRLCVRGTAVALVAYAALLATTYWGFANTPTGFIPDQDKGYLLVNIQLPDAASVERTAAISQQIERICLGDKSAGGRFEGPPPPSGTPLYKGVTGIVHTVNATGQSFLIGANGSNFASIFVILDSFHHRRDPELHADAIEQQLRALVHAEVQDAQVAIFGAPPVDGLGNAGGFKIMVQDRGDRGLADLQKDVDALTDAGNNADGLMGLFSTFRAATPQFYIDINREKCKRMGVPLGDVFLALQANLGGLYVNDFNEFGRTWRVNIQADARYRVQPENIRRIQVRNAKGGMVPLGSVCRIEEIDGPVMVVRYNMYPAAAINGGWAPGYSSGQAITAMNALAGEHLSTAATTEWTELTKLQIDAGNTALFIFPLCVLFVFLTHSAEYESWALPLAIILIVPMSLLCALGGAHLHGLDNDLFLQIGFVVLAGLACKNAVLIVEFAKQQREQGKTPFEAAVEASRLRLRPILMTSFAFILGVVPLMIAAGAGAEMRRTLGTGVFFGMLGVTFFGVFLTPVFYYVLQNLSEWWSPHVAHEPADASATGKHDGIA
jgi:multidrug efflux pump